MGTREGEKLHDPLTAVDKLVSEQNNILLHLLELRKKQRGNCGVAVRAAHTPEQSKGHERRQKLAPYSDNSWPHLVPLFTPTTKKRHPLHDEQTACKQCGCKEGSMSRCEARALGHIQHVFCYTSGYVFHLSPAQTCNPSPYFECIVTCRLRVVNKHRMTQVWIEYCQINVKTAAVKQTERNMHTLYYVM